MGLRSFCTGTTSQPIFLFEFYHRIQPLTTGILKLNIPFIFDSARVGFALRRPRKVHFARDVQGWAALTAFPCSSLPLLSLWDISP